MDAATENPANAVRDYGAEYYVRQLRETYAARRARAFTADDFTAVFSDLDRLSLLRTTKRLGPDHSIDYAAYLDYLPA